MPGPFFDVHAKSLAGRRRSGARPPIAIDCVPGGFMEILAAIKREEKKLEKQLGKLQHQLNGIRAAAKALGDSTNRELKVVKKRVMSAAARAKIGKAAKKRWAKFRAQAKKVAG
jgi:hypothetical protein